MLWILVDSGINTYIWWSLHITISTIQMTPFEALYGRKCWSPLHWDEVRERTLLGPKLVQQAVDKIQIMKQRMKVAQDRYKSCVDQRRRPLKF